MTAVPLSMNPSPLTATQKLIFVNTLFCVSISWSLGSLYLEGFSLRWFFVPTTDSYIRKIQAQKVVVGV